MCIYLYTYLFICIYDVYMSDAHAIIFILLLRFFRRTNFYIAEICRINVFTQTYQIFTNQILTLFRPQSFLIQVSHK